MRSATQVKLRSARQPSVLLTVAAALLGLAACVTATRPDGMARNGPATALDYRSPPQEVDDRNQSREAKATPAGLTKQDDPAHHRASSDFVARARKSTGSWYLSKAGFSRRIAECNRALSHTCSTTGSGQLPVVQISWPMGRSAAESVVLLRRLLI
jgi:hypothetical protein